MQRSTPKNRMEMRRIVSKNNRGRWEDLQKNRKQDKEVGINPDFDEAEAGNPLCRACGTEEMKRSKGRPVKIGIEKHIRITDSELTDKINLLMKMPGYENFNKVINEALFYGLPILAEKICGDAVTQEERAALTTPRKIGSREEKFYAVVVQLLREAVLNVTINKSILSSLYHEKSEEIAKDRDRANRFDSGLMSDTPEYLERYEAEGIKKLRR